MSLLAHFALPRGVANGLLHSCTAPFAMHENQREPESGAEAGEDHPDSA